MTAGLTMMYRDHQKHAESFLFTVRWPCKQRRLQCGPCLLYNPAQLTTKQRYRLPPQGSQTSSCCPRLWFRSTTSDPPAIGQRRSWSAEQGAGWMRPPLARIRRGENAELTVQKSRVRSRTMTTKFTMKLELNIPQKM